ncbi:hypothetical protein L21SP3_02195 [Sedimentisphaera cyanobacteriorum]|uniref:Uncharacterized protein n=1 Tax=Sedimentisphaera cyanobacteriorum TaxID=1940790 RepID=A0A1Q2HSX5_9BACT|nr:hypothetical protein [Sedimentisphaera cyanobacteriorum]AQQ10363.1 hypothetical protein L21SP3_02195 [Sedimentisphaera cyanobacteriorum]
MNAKECVWKVRSVKSYPEAKNHIFVGKPSEINSTYVLLKCKTFHFGKNVNTVRDIQVGKVEYRIMPWSRIEIVNVLDKDFEYKSAQLSMGEKGQINLTDGSKEVLIYTSNDSRVF